MSKQSNISTAVVFAAFCALFHIRNRRIASEKALLENSVRTVRKGYSHMLACARDTAAMRHEWKHDLLMLSLLYEEGKITEIGAYLREKNKCIRECGWESLTGCFALDVILSSVSVRAKAEGIKLETHADVPSRLNIKEEDLCRLLLNMFDNAFHACAEREKDRFIKFSAVLKNGFLAVKCSNSAPAVPARRRRTEDFRHGYGLKMMKKICRSYGSELITDTGTPGIFTVKALLQLNRTEKQ